MTLTDFLLARIDEDEATAELAGRINEGPVVEGVVMLGSRTSPFRPARVLAECEAKRRIVEHCDYDHLALSPGDPYVLQLLALPYADHPDYDPDWRP